MLRTISRLEILASVCLLFTLIGLFVVVGYNVARNDEALFAVINNPVPNYALSLQDASWDLRRALEHYVHDGADEARYKEIKDGMRVVQARLDDLGMNLHDNVFELPAEGSKLSLLRPIGLSMDAIDRSFSNGFPPSDEDLNVARRHINLLTEGAQNFVRGVFDYHHGEVASVLLKIEKDEALWIVLAILVVGASIFLIVFLMRTAQVLHKNAEVAWAMERYNALFASALESVHVGVLIRDMQKQDRPVVFVNKAFTQMTGHDYDYMRSKSSDILFGWHTQTSVIEAFHEAIQDQRAANFNVLVYRRDGSSFWGEWHISPVRGKDGKLTHYVSLITDISVLRQAQEGLLLAKEHAERASAVKTNFLATMSHEIRTPINGLLGVMDLLSETPLDDDQRKLLDTACASGRALHEIINDILDYAKMEAGRIELSLQPFSLRVLLQEIVDVTWPLAQRKGIELNLDVQEQVPDFYVSDPGRIRQVVLNLVSNAIKFTEKGGVSVRVIFLMTQESDGKQVALLRFEVVDTGIGIGGADQDKLFQEFSQIERSYTRRFGGTGLGLAISRRLVTMMNGEIGVESKPSQGSTFWFMLPLPIAAEGAVLPTLQKREEQAAALTVGAPVQVVQKSAPVGDGALAEEQPAVQGGGACVYSHVGKQNILLVEDNETNRMVAARYLQKAGFEPDMATNGVEAVRATKKKAYDLILMDISMAEMDGIEATRVIRAEGINGATIPIIALTAHVMQGDRERFLAAGMNDHLHKPLRYDTMIQAISQWIKLPDLKVEVRAGKNIVSVAGASSGADDLNVDVLRQLAGDLGNHAVWKITGVFLRDSAERIFPLLMGDVADLAQIREIAHTIKSSSASCGLGRLSRTMTVLESASAAGDVEKVREICSTLSDVYKNASESLEKARIVFKPQEK